MKIKKIAHIGIAVNNINESAKFYTESLSLNTGSLEKFNDLNIAFINVGDSNIELLQSNNFESIISNYIKKRGEGIHHLAFEVENINTAIAELKAKKVPLISNEFQLGFRGAKVIFIHPKYTNGVLIELCEYPKKL